jgi:phage recombination protein Bet
MTDLTLERYDPRDTALYRDTVTREQIDLLKNTICKGATDAELQLFVTVCNHRGLDPFAGQIHAVKRNQYNPDLNDGKGGYEKVMTIQTGIDGYRVIAERTHLYLGQTKPAWCGPDGVWRSIWLEDDPPAAAMVGILKKGCPEPFYGIARWKAYVQTGKNGQPNRMWDRMDAEQLLKCAEALGLRKAFPQDLSGIYTDEEMGQADDAPVGLAVTHVAPVSPAAPTGYAPTLDDINGLRSPADAKAFVKTLSEPYQQAMLQAVSQLSDESWPEFWRNAPLEDWRVVLHHALQTVLQSEGAVSPDPPPSAPAGGDAGNREDRSPSERAASSPPADSTTDGDQ